MANVNSPFKNTLTIASGESVSSVLDLTKTDGQTVSALVVPAAWTAAGIAFKVSHDGVTYGPLYDARDPSGVVEYAIPAADALVTRCLSLDVGVFDGFNYVKVVSGTNAAPVNQGAERTLYVMTRRV
jgi:hypothetical protein